MVSGRKQTLPVVGREATATGRSFHLHSGHMATVPVLLQYLPQIVLEGAGTSGPEAPGSFLTAPSAALVKCWVGWPRLDASFTTYWWRFCFALSFKDLRGRYPATGGRLPLLRSKPILEGVPQ